MNSTGRVLLGTGIIAALNFGLMPTGGLSAAAQTTNDTQAGMAIIEATTPHPETDAPRFGNFYTFQHLEKQPPLPFDALNLPFWDLGGGIYLVDDRNVDYAALQAAADAEAESEAALRPNSRFSMMASSLLNTSYAYGNPVYLTNMWASLGGSVTTASFSIAGGTNFVPYDILTTTNMALRFSQWTWLGIGYTSNFYTFTNQPSDQSYYALARPQQTMVVGWGMDDGGQVEVPSGLTNALMVAGGDAQSLALLNNGTVVAWGTNDLGEGTVPTNLAGVTMIAAGLVS